MGIISRPMAYSPPLTVLRPIDVCILDSWDPGFGDFMKNSYYYYPKNLDHNSGNPIGVSVCQSSANGRKRVTASGSYLKSGMPKLKIMTQVAVTKILFQGKKAVGVESDGSQCSFNSSA